MAAGKITKTEAALLALTGLFLCGLLTVSARDRRAAARQGVETEIQVPQEEILPDLSPLNLNTATAEELDQLPGIGEELARRIVAYRTENGPFSDIRQIMEVSGIGEGKFDELEDRITIDDGEGLT